jgi:hypothetical protein
MQTGFEAMLPGDGRCEGNRTQLVSCMKQELTVADGKEKEEVESQIRSLLSLSLSLSLSHPSSPLLGDRRREENTKQK